MKWDEVVFGGCNSEQDYIEILKDWLQSNKTLVVDGPPGSGKTMLFWRLKFLFQKPVGISYDLRKNLIENLIDSESRKDFLFFDNAYGKLSLPAWAYKISWASNNRVSVAITTHEDHIYSTDILNIKLSKLTKFREAFTDMLKFIEDNREELLL